MPQRKKERENEAAHLMNKIKKAKRKEGMIAKIRKERKFFFIAFQVCTLQVCPFFPTGFNFTPLLLLHFFIDSNFPNGSKAVCI